MQIPAPTHHLVVILFYFVQYRHLQISWSWKIDGSAWIDRCQKPITSMRNCYRSIFCLNAIIRAHKEQFGSISDQSGWLP